MILPGATIGIGDGLRQPVVQQQATYALNHARLDAILDWRDLALDKRANPINCVRCSL